MPRAVAQILQSAGYEFGLMGEQWCCGGPAAEMGYVDQAQRFARHNLDNWRATGTTRVLVLDPHDYITFTEDYPKYFGAEFDIEVVLVVELLAELHRDGPAHADGAAWSARSPTTTRAGSTSARASGRSRARSCAPSRA